MCNSLVLQPPPHIIVSNTFPDLKKESYDFLDNTEGELAPGPARHEQQGEMEGFSTCHRVT